MALIKKLKYLNKSANKLLRLLFEPLGIEVFSKPARYGMDDKLAKYLPTNGVFVEAGATDGYTESNTYYLEKFKSWKGVLIEPIPYLYKKCVKERPHSKVFNCALVAKDYSDTIITMKQGYLMSTVAGALGETETEHLEKASYFHGTDSKEIIVPARTLTSVLQEAGFLHIDFLSLDVEGYELNVLKGLDFNRYKPIYMLIEFLAEDKKREAESYILDRYNFVEKLSKRDYLYKSR